MSHSARESIYEAISSIRLIDPHTHINPHQPASSTLADLLGYHYYTELAHSAGMPKGQIEDDDLDPRTLVQRMVGHLGPIDNTAQYRWLIEICQKFFGFEHDRIDASNWEQAYDLAEDQMRLAEWPQMVLDQSNVEAVFLTNDFDDELSGFDASTYIPCLRTDDLVFQLAKPQTRARLEACTGIELDGSLVNLRESLRQRFEYFSANGGRACAISLPPSFQPGQVSDGRTATALDQVLRKGELAEPEHQSALSRRVFWTLAELCDEYAMPFDLMIGVNRSVYTNGVYQGQDLYDSRVSLIQYAALFNAFPKVKFPVSVLASVTNQELVSYAWIFPNVITNGHWWYSNTPSFIARDAAARLEAVPRTKQIAYYSDAYKLEFVWPKFDMYRHILAGILADHFVGSCRWSEERAIELGKQVLRDNVDQVFRSPYDDDVVEEPTVSAVIEPSADAPAAMADDNDTWENDAAAVAGSAALAAGAIGMVEITDAGEPALPADDSEPLTVAPGSLDETADEFSTVYDEEATEPLVESEMPPPDAEDIQGFLESEEDRAPDTDIGFEPDDDEAAASDRPTVHELDDTVKMETVEIEAGSPAADAEEDHDFEVAGVDIHDPLPTEDEVQAVGLDDVELIDDAAEESFTDAGAIEQAVDAEPLDVGEVLAEPDSAAAEEIAADIDDGEIRMLRGEESFSLDEDSLQLQPDPLTGELTLPVPGNDDDDLMSLSDGDDAAAAATSESDVDLADAFVEAGDDSGIVETIEIDDDHESVDFDDLEQLDSAADPATTDTVDLEDNTLAVDVENSGEMDPGSTATTGMLEETLDLDVDLAGLSNNLGIAETVDLEQHLIADDDDQSVLDDLGNEEPTEVSDQPADPDRDPHHVLDDLGDEQVDHPVADADDDELNDLGLDEFELEDEAGIAESPSFDDPEDDESVR